MSVTHNCVGSRRADSHSPNSSTSRRRPGAGSGTITRTAATSEVRRAPGASGAAHSTGIRSPLTFCRMSRAARVPAPKPGSRGSVTSSRASGLIRPTTGTRASANRFRVARVAMSRMSITTGRGARPDSRRVSSAPVTAHSS